jgi:hypothetical protein
MQVPILAYHATNVAGNDYQDNDHVAFARDLRLIHELGLRIVPLRFVVDQILQREDRDLHGCVALCCDDASDFDYFDLEHPSFGPQRSLHNSMTDFLYEAGFDAQPDLHLTAFAIASPQARAHLSRTCLAGMGWNDTWWRAALQSGRVAIESHSWDHNHDSIPEPGLTGMQRGSFGVVDDHARADIEIAQATRYLNKRLAPFQSTLFCYPYGQTNDYLRCEYFPNFAHEHGMLAAFGDGAKPATADADRWNLPRYICGWHWKSSDDLRAILREVRAR